jgi:nitroimidazol reductase NimA-like FMN-containing flavoprotein (pyridoxamine 5'-phosphate oxidase superfamily)
MTELISTRPLLNGGERATPWVEAHQRLGAADFYWLATVGRQEKPHVRPLLAVWLEGALYFCAGAATRKAKNLAHNRYCTVTAVSADAHLVVEGEALRV